VPWPSYEASQRGPPGAEIWQCEPRMPARNTTHIVVGRTRCWGLCHKAAQNAIGRPQMLVLPRRPRLSSSRCARPTVLQVVTVK
jgi:hypothetical protein